MEVLNTTFLPNCCKAQHPCRLGDSDLWEWLFPCGSWGCLQHVGESSGPLQEGRTLAGLAVLGIYFTDIWACSRFFFPDWCRLSRNIVMACAHRKRNCFMDLSTASWQEGGASWGSLDFFCCKLSYLQIGLDQNVESHRYFLTTYFCVNSFHLSWGLGQREQGQQRLWDEQSKRWQSNLAAALK